MTNVDNRTQLQDCQASADVSGDSDAAPSTTSTVVGTFIESTASVAFQVDDAQEHILFDQDSASATFNIDLSDSTVYCMIKFGTGETFANLGGLVCFNDGADGGGGDDIGYIVTGADVSGLPYEFGFFGMKIDVSVVVATPGTNNVDYFIYNGTEAGLDHTQVLQVGFGSFSLVKAVSTSANAWFDGIYYITNGSYALTINGGTVGTPETTADVAADDVTAGAGMVNNPKGSEYGFFAPTQWGDPPAGTADSYFTGTDEQWYLIGDNGGGHAIGATHFPFRVVGNTTGTNSFVLTRVVIVNTGTRAQFDLSDNNMDFTQLDGCSLIDLGAITGPTTNDADKFLVDTIFNNCDQYVPNEMNMDDCTFNGTTDSTGAMLLDETQDATAFLTGMTFNSDGTGHGILIAPTGAGPFTYNFDNFQNSGYGADDTGDAFVRVLPSTSTANITINLQNGAGTITVDDTAPYTGTVTINNAQTVEVNGLTEGAAVVVLANETVGTITTGDVIFELLADSTGTATLTTFNYEAAFDPSGLDVIVRARQQGLPNYAISQDNATFVDQTTAANSSTVDDLTLLITAPVAGQDYYYFGHAEQFEQLKLDISTAGTGGFTIVWEYWNGAWTSLSGVSDGTSSFSSTGENTVSWTLPGDWATTSVDGNGPVFYVRAAYSAGTVTIAPLGRKAKLDVTRYLPFVQNNTIESTGLTVTASWAEDNIAIF